VDPDVDELLLQLDDLDARTEALQITAPPEAAPKGLGTAEADAKSALTAAQAVARQHPLHALPLGLMSGNSSQLRWSSARPRREKRQAHLIPDAEVLDAAPSFADVFVDSKFADAGPRMATSPESEQHGKVSMNSFSLPPLKPSASAPSCFMRGSWPDTAARGC